MEPDRRNYRMYLSGWLIAALLAAVPKLGAMQGTELPAASSSQEEKAMMVQGQADDGSGAEGGDGLAA